MQIWASQVVLVVKNPPANAGETRDAGSISESERSPGGGHSKPLLARRTPWTEEPGGLPSIVLQRVRHNLGDLGHTHRNTNKSFNI